MCGFFVLDLNTLGLAAGLGGSVAATVFRALQTAACPVVGGRPIEPDGKIGSVDTGRVIAEHNQRAARFAAIS